MWTSVVNCLFFQNKTNGGFGFEMLKSSFVELKYQNQRWSVHSGLVEILNEQIVNGS